MIPFVRVLFRPKKDSQIPFKDFHNWTQLRIRRGLNVKSNEVSIDLRNNHVRYLNEDGKFFFSQDDEIEVYLSSSPIVKSTDLLMAGRLQNIAERIEGENRNIRLEYQDRTVSILDKFFATGHNFTSTTADQIVKKVVGFADQNLEPNQKIDVTTFVTTTRPTVTFAGGDTGGGDAFPTISMYLNNKTVVEWVQEASLVENVNTPSEQTNSKLVLPRGMFFYLDNNNKFHWEVPSTTSAGNILSNGSDVFNLDLKKTKRDLINMVIFKMTPDKDGSGITWYYYNRDTEQPELHMKVINMDDIPKTYVDELIRTDNRSTTLTSELSATATTADVADTTGFASTGTIKVGAEFVEYTGKTGTTFTGLKRGSFGSTAGTHASGGKVQDATTFGSKTNAAFRTECKLRGQKRSAAIIAGVSGLRWRGSVEMRGNKYYNVGQMVSITSPEHGLDSFKMRVIDVEHIIGTGWTTTYSIEEDESVLAKVGAA